MHTPACSPTRDSSSVNDADANGVRQETTGETTDADSEPADAPVQYRSSGTRRLRERIANSRPITKSTTPATIRITARVFESIPGMLISTAYMSIAPSTTRTTPPPM